MRSTRFMLASRLALAALAVSATGTSCSSPSSVLTPTASEHATPTPTPIAPTATPTAAGSATPTPAATATPTPAATATPTSVATATPTPAVTATPTPVASATPTVGPTPTAAPTSAAACGTIYSFAPSESGGSISEKATSSCSISATFDYPSFTLSPATSADPYQFILDLDTKLDSGLINTFKAIELCKSAPGVLYGGVEVAGGASGPSIDFGTTGPDGVGGTVASNTFVAGRTYTVYGELTTPFDISLGSTTLTATASGSSGSLAGGALTITQPGVDYPSGTIGEIEVCYPS